VTLAGVRQQAAPANYPGREFTLRRRFPEPNEWATLVVTPAALRGSRLFVTPATSAELGFQTRTLDLQRA
jgi:hypothetical protein